MVCVCIVSMYADKLLPSQNYKYLKKNLLYIIISFPFDFP